MVFRAPKKKKERYGSKLNEGIKDAGTKRRSTLTHADAHRWVRAYAQRYGKKKTERDNDREGGKARGIGRVRDRQVGKDEQKKESAFSELSQQSPSELRARKLKQELWKEKENF